MHGRHNNFYAPITPSYGDQRQRKQIINTETDTTAIMLQPLKDKIDKKKDKITSNKFKDIDIKSCTYYFFNDIISIKIFDPNKFKTDEN